MRALPRRAHVLLVDATGRDHPRHAGLALQLGAVGVTHRGLLAASKWPADEPSATAPLVLGAELVGCWVGGSRGRRALAVYAARRTDAEIAVEIVVTRTPHEHAGAPPHGSHGRARRASRGRS